MDISIARNLSKTNVSKKTEDLEVATFVDELLNNIFQADFITLETAQKEANDLAIEKNRLVNEKSDLAGKLETKTTEAVQLTKTVNDTIVERDDLDAKLTAEQIKTAQLEQDKIDLQTAHDIIIAEKDKQIEELTAQIAPVVEPPIEPVEITQ